MEAKALESQVKARFKENT